MKAQLFKTFREICLNAPNFEAALAESKAKKDVPDEIAQHFYTYYAKNGMISAEAAFKDLYIEILKPYTLNLTLRKAPFDVMVTGEKTEEFRNPTEWLNSRLYDDENNLRRYKLVKFVNGYGADKPAFIAYFKEVLCCFDRYGYCFSRTWSNGLKVRKINTKELYIIDIGEVIEKYNLT